MEESFPYKQGDKNRISFAGVKNQKKLEKKILQLKTVQTESLNQASNHRL